MGVRHHGEVIAALRGDGEVARLASRAGISEGRWRQIEKFGGGPAQTIYRMVVAVGGGASDVERAFKLAGFADVYDGLVGAGARRRPGLPGTAELGVSSDLTLSPEDRERALDYIAQLRKLAEFEGRGRPGETEGA